MIKVNGYYVTIIAPDKCLVTDSTSTGGKWFLIENNNGIINVNGELFQLVDQGVIKL